MRLTEEDLEQIMKANPDLKVQQEQPVAKIPNIKQVKPNKYHAKRTYSKLCHRFFHSKGEAERGEELRLLEMAGKIQDLRFQVKFTLCDKPKVTIAIDFSYMDDGVRIFEDFKGVLTRDFRTKLAWLQTKKGMIVILSKRS